MSCASGRPRGRDAETLGFLEGAPGSVSALPPPHTPERRPWLWRNSPKSRLTRRGGLLPAGGGRGPGRRAGFPRQRLLSLALLGPLDFKAHSCLFCLNAFFFKVLAICLAFSNPCWDLRSSLYFTTRSWQAPLVEIQTEATWWGNRHKNINSVDIKKNHTGDKLGAVHWLLSSSKWSS